MGHPWVLGTEDWTDIPSILAVTQFILVAVPELAGPPGISSLGLERQEEFYITCTIAIFFTATRAFNYVDTETRAKLQATAG